MGVGAGGEFGVAEGFDPIVDLFFEFIFVDEAVDLDGAEEWPMPLSTLRDAREPTADERGILPSDCPLLGISCAKPCCTLLGLSSLIEDLA